MGEMLENLKSDVLSILTISVYKPKSFSHSIHPFSMSAFCKRI